MARIALRCVPVSATSFNFLLMTVCGWVNRRQLAVIEYLHEENRVLREQLGKKRLRLTDSQRRRLAEKGKVLGRKTLRQLCQHRHARHPPALVPAVDREEVRRLHETPARPSA